MRREMPMFAEAKTMTQRLDPPTGRRDVLRVLTGVVAADGTAPLAPAAADSEKRKARYQPDSPEVQTFYRVNRYPAR
jgi:hypothetical protein